jgi:hypothetical protein
MTALIILGTIASYGIIYAVIRDTRHTYSAARRQHVRDLLK